MTTEVATASWLEPHARLLGGPDSPVPVDDPGELAEIRDLLIRYVACYDRGDIDGILATFTKDASYATFLGEFHGLDEIRGNFVALVERYVRAAHLLTNQTIRLTGPDSAAACAYVHAAVETKDGLSYAFVGSYNDRLRKVGGRWRIAERKVLDGMSYTIASIDPAGRLNHDDSGSA